MFWSHDSTTPPPASCLPDLSSISSLRVTVGWPSGAYSIAVSALQLSNQSRLIERRRLYLLNIDESFEKVWFLSLLTSQCQPHRISDVLFICFTDHRTHSSLRLPTLTYALCHDLLLIYSGNS